MHACPSHVPGMGCSSALCSDTVGVMWLDVNVDAVEDVMLMGAMVMHVFLW